MLGKIGINSTRVSLARLDKKQYYCIQNFFVQKNGASIDYVIISRYGIFVIKMSTQKGIIEGTEHSDTWTQQVLKRKRRFANPVKQCKIQAKAIRKLLQTNKIPVIPIVVFGMSAQLKIKVNTHVILANNLLNIIYRYDQEVLTSSEMEKIIKEFNGYTSQKNIRKTRIYNVKDILEERKRLVDADICPKCGNKLVIREGKGRKYKSCSKYPKCKFRHGL